MIKFNITDTSSNAASILLDLQVGGTSKFKVSKAGVVTTLALASEESRILEPSASGTSYTGFTAPALSGNVIYTLPAADGDANQALTTNGSAALSWASGGTDHIAVEVFN